MALRHSCGLVFAGILRDALRRGPEIEFGSTQGPHALPSTVGTMAACKDFAWVGAGRLGTCRAHDWRPKLSLNPPVMGVWICAQESTVEGLRWLGKHVHGRDWPWAVRASTNIWSQRDCCWGECGEAVPPPTFLLHSCSEALLKPAVSALVSFVFVYHTLPVKPGKKER